MEHAVARPKQAEHGPEAANRRKPGAQLEPPLHPMLEMQQQAGNQAMQELLRTRAIQAKLSISQPGDPDEQEADAVAARVMRSHAGAEAAATSCSCGDDEDEICDECRQNAGVARKAGEVAGAPGQRGHAAIGPILRSPGHALEGATRAFFEPRFGRDFSGVRVHTDVSAAASASSVQALAYTVGEHIVFGRAQYAPGSAAGTRLLAHELAHVVQQGSAGSTAASRSLSIDTSGESNAEQVTRNLVAGRTAGPIHTGHGLSVQRQWTAPEIPPDIGKFGEWGKIGEWGKFAPPENPLPLPEPAPTPTPTPAPSPSPAPTPAPTPGTTPGPGPWWANPMPVPPIAPTPQKTPDDDKKKDPQCGTKDMPLTMVTFSPGPLGQGGRVKASPLTKCPGNTVGSPPDGSIYRQEFDCINAAGQGGSWVRAHILHGQTSSSGPFNLHGPGDDVRNLIITDKSLNGQMSNQAEKPVIGSVYRNNAVMWYDSKVDSYEPGKETFGQSITVTAGMYDTNTNTEGPALPGIGGTFTLKKTPPNCPPSLAAPIGPPAPGAQSVTPPVAPETAGRTPNANLEFQSTLKLCAKELASPEFKVTNGGLEVDIFADWFNNAGDTKLDVSACPYDHYLVVLEQAGLLWGFNQYSQKPITIPVGRRIPPLVWKGLPNDTYRLKIYVDDSLDRQPGAAGTPCCLRSDITVSTFSAPAMIGPIEA
jgi:hypothetical protein